MKINIHKEVEIEPTIRTELLSSMFEVPAKTKLSVTLTGESEHDNRNRDYNIGLIVGPSGSGKTLLLEDIFGTPQGLVWGSKSVIDDFPQNESMENISRVCQAVGFNTIPSWLRPFSVLSNGERFRVEVARRLLDVLHPIYMDEFTSVVDRQVAQFACHAIQKYVREAKKKLVVASCHYDIIPWLQPDWILEPGNPCKFTWRSLCPRPSINVSVSRVKYEVWHLFKDFHYMSQDLNKAARCYGLYVATNAAERTDGMAVGFHDDELHSYKNEDSSSLGGRSGTRVSSSGSYGSGGDGKGDSQSLVREGRGVSEFRYSENDATRCQNPTNSSTLSDVSKRSATLHDQQVSMVPPTEVETESKLQVFSTFGGRPDGCLRPGLREDTSHRIASMCGVLYRPHPKVRDIMGFTRMVTLPDYQGLGLAFVLANTVAAAYKSLGKRLHSYPNHPSWIRSYQRSKNWMQVKEAGVFSPRRGDTSTVGGFGNRRCAVFQYIGDAMNREDAERLINGD